MEKPENQSESSRFRKVYSLKVYIKLEQMGINPITNLPNPKKPNLLCWIYEDTEEFRGAFGKIMKEV